MKKIICLLLAVAFGTVAAPVMADSDKHKNGHGKHKHKYHEAERRPEGGVVVLQPPRPGNVVIEGPSVTVKPPRITVK